MHLIDDFGMYHNNVEFPEEIGNKQIKYVKLTNNKIFIQFFDTNSYILLKAVSECRSISWFEFNNKICMSTLLNKYIKEIIVGDDEDSDVDSDDSYEFCEVIKIKQIIIVTNDGNINFELKNSSPNGYYSGWLDVIQHKKIEK